MNRLHKLVALVGTLLLLALVGHQHLSNISQHAVQLHLQLYGSSIYEHHELTGQWPDRTEDLAKTSLALQSPHWQRMLEEQAFVIVWSKQLQANPEDNRAVLLGYHNRGLLASQGRQWVCWGDLRTECLTKETLEAHLAGVRD